MKTECPNCFTDVIPMANGHCPSCGQPLSGFGAGRFTKVTVRQTDDCVEVCLKCGCPTSQRLRVRKKCKNSNFQPAANSINQHPLAVILDWVSGKYHQSVEVTVALCNSCRKAGIVEPKYIDFEGRSMTFVGHKNCRDEILRLRREKENG